MMTLSPILMPPSLPPWGGSGLKYDDLITNFNAAHSLPPWGGSGLKYTSRMTHRPRSPCLPPWGGSGLKWFWQRDPMFVVKSPSLGREWIEIRFGAGHKTQPQVSLLGEGVD